MDKETNGHLYIANDNLKRIADALEEILRLVKKDLEKNGMADKPSHTPEEIKDLIKPDLPEDVPFKGRL